MIYLDYAAATPVDPRAIAAMQPYFGELFGNPASLHSAGTAVKAALDSSRQSVARLLDCSPTEIIFTSGTTEAINLAISSTLDSAANKAVVVIDGGHSASREALKKAGATTKAVGLQSDGSVKVNDVISALTPKPISWSLTGSITKPAPLTQFTSSQSQSTSSIKPANITLL